MAGTVQERRCSETNHSRELHRTAACLQCSSAPTKAKEGMTQKELREPSKEMTPARSSWTPIRKVKNLAICGAPSNQKAIASMVGKKTGID